MTHDDADEPTRPTPQGSSPYDRPDPWAKPPAGGSMPPPQPYAAAAGAPDGAPYGQSPYASPPPGQPSSGQPPYAGQQPDAPYGAQYGPQYGAQYGAQQYGSPMPPEVVQLRSSATLWLVLNIVSVPFWGWLAGGLLGIVGAIFAGIALGEIGTDPTSAKRKIRVAKILFFVGLGVSVLIAIVGVVALILFANSIDTSTFEPAPSSGV